MTGFGKTEFEVNNKKITIEIKSLNSKQTDINTRIPVLYREKEIFIRKMLSEALIRGKIDFSFYVENLGDESNSKINEAILKSYFHHLRKINDDLKLLTDQTTMHAALRLPDVVKQEYETLDEEEWQIILGNIKKAIAAIEQFRIQEGEAMKIDLTGNIKRIRDLLKTIEPHEEERINNLKSRLTEHIEALELNGRIDENRLEQELLFYLERLDINEEKVRLANHCDYFLDTVEESTSNGK